MASLTNDDILHIAADAYSAESDGLCTLPRTYEEAQRHTNGDTLADFIVIELHEALDGEAPARRLIRAITTLTSARRQLDAVIQALQKHTDRPILLPSTSTF